MFFSHSILDFVFANLDYKQKIQMPSKIKNNFHLQTGKLCHVHSYSTPVGCIYSEILKKRWTQASTKQDYFPVSPFAVIS